MKTNLVAVGYYATVLMGTAGIAFWAAVAH
jgi:hypothetical protein